MKSKEIYLHIGMPKTATSSLQRFFAVNRTVLRQKGIAYPACDNMDAHHRLGWAMLSERGLAHSWFAGDLDSSVNEWKKLIDQCVLSRNLITTETLWGSAAENMSLIRKLTSPFRVNVVIYLRRQDFFKESMYCEQIKMGIEKGRDRNIKDPEKRFASWERTFGKDRLIVRPFERGQFYKGNVYADFMKSVFDEELTDEYVIPGIEINTRFHQATLEYKRLINHLPMAPDELYATIEPLIKINAMFDENGRKREFIFSPDQRRAVVEKCLPFYSRVAADYLRRPDGVLFYDPLPDSDGNWQARTELTRDDAAAINQFMVARFPEVLKRIAGAIANARIGSDKSTQEAANRLLPGIPPEWLVPGTVEWGRPAASRKTIGQRTIFDEVYSTRLWTCLKVFRPIYKVLPDRLKRKSVSIVHKLHCLFNRPRIALEKDHRRLLIIHVGTVKTGTTALQRFFSENREILRAKGITYPKNKNRAHAHHCTSWSFVLRDGIARSHWPEDIQCPKKEWEYLLNQISGQTGLISSEHLVRSSIEVIRQIRKFTRDFNVKIVVYWRRRDTLEDSWYNQLTKKGNNISKPTFREGLTSKKHLDMWADVFGKENVIVRPYEKGQLYQGDVLADFLHHIFGFEIGDEFVLPEQDANTRLHTVVLEYKRLINLLPLSRSQRHGMTNPLRDLSSVLDGQGRRSFPVFSPAQRLALIQKYAAENETIAREYLGRPDGRLFYDPLPDPNQDWQPYEELLQEDARTINRFLAEHYPAVLDKIVQGIQETVFYRNDNMRQAALRLIPGISPERVNASLLSETNADGKWKNYYLQQDDLDGLNALMKSKRLILPVGIYHQMPRLVRRPALAVAKAAYRFIKYAVG